MDSGYSIYLTVEHGWATPFGNGPAFQVNTPWTDLFNPKGMSAPLSAEYQFILESKRKESNKFNMIDRPNIMAACTGQFFKTENIGIS